MPDKDGQLTKEEKKTATGWIEDKTPRLGCPACKQSHFTLGDHLVTPMMYTGSGITIGGPAYPQLMVICSNCSYTLYYNAVMMGIAEPLDESKNKEDEEPKKETGKIEEGEQADG